MALGAHYGNAHWLVFGWLGVPSVHAQLAPLLFPLLTGPVRVGIVATMKSEDTTSRVDSKRSTKNSFIVVPSL